MVLKTLSPYLLVKVPKKEEQEKREKENGLYLHPSFVWMTRNTQCGIIDYISPGAAKELPNSKVGDIAILHHFVQGSQSVKENKKKFLIHEDDTYFYYNVTSKEYLGQNNQCYGTYNGSVITPNKDYVFLEKEIENKEGWHQTPEQIYAKLESIKNRVLSLTKDKINPEIIREVHKLEKEQYDLSMNLQKKEFLPYKVVASNNTNVTPGTIVHALNIACQTIINFLGIEYRVVETKYIGAI